MEFIGGFGGETTSDVFGVRRAQATRIGLRPGLPPQTSPRFGDQPYRNMVEQAVDGLLVVANDDGRIVYCNPAAAALLQSSRDTLTGSPFGDRKSVV